MVDSRNFACTFVSISTIGPPCPQEYYHYVRHPPCGRQIILAMNGVREYNDLGKNGITTWFGGLETTSITLKRVGYLMEHRVYLDDVSLDIFNDIVYLDILLGYEADPEFFSLGPLENVTLKMTFVDDQKFSLDKVRNVGEVYLGEETSYGSDFKSKSNKRKSNKRKSNKRKSIKRKSKSNKRKSIKRTIKIDF